MYIEISTLGRLNPTKNSIVPDQRRNRKILLKEVLAELQAEELKNFIQFYAKKDKGFELALKSHFISRIQVSDQDSKYKRILGEIIKPKTSSNSKIGQTGRKIIGIILTDFTHQMSDLLSKENYTEAFYIIKNSLDKIAYAQTQFEINDKTIETARLTFLDGLEVILKHEIAPRFRAIVEADLLEIVFKSYYLPKKENIISLMNQQEVLTSKDKKKLILSLLDKKQRMEDHIQLVSILHCLAHPFDKLVKTVHKEFKPLTINQAMLHLIENGQLDVVEFILQSDSIDFNYNKEVLEILILDKKKNYKKLTRLLKTIKKSEFSHLVIQQIVDGLSDDYLQLEITNLSRWVNQLGISHQCKLYAKGQSYDDLVNILHSQNDLEWLKAYDKFLLDKGMNKEVKALYLHTVQTFMENHIGKQARLYLDKFEDRLKFIGEHNMLFEIKEVLMENYGHRKAFTIF